MTRDIYEQPAAGAPPAVERRRPPSWLVFVAGVALGALATAIPAAVRGDLPAAAPPPQVAATPRPPILATDVMDWDGYGLIQLGMSASDYRSMFSTSPYWDADLLQMSLDRAHDCIQYRVMLPQSGPDTWAWVRADRVVAVGVPYSRDLTTSFGPALGDAADLDWDAGSSNRWGQWRLDTSAPVFVMRRTKGDAVATLIDGDADGSLDGVSVATQDGEECRPDPDSDLGLAPPPGGPTIKGNSLSGATMGMTAEQFDSVAEWTGGREDSSDGCRRVAFGDGRRAYLTDVVVALEAPEVLDGPVLGQTVDEMMANLGAAAVLTWTEDNERGWYDAVVALPDNRRFRVTALVPSVIPEGLDHVVVVPEGDIGQRVVSSIILGEPC